MKRTLPPTKALPLKLIHTRTLRDKTGRQSVSPLGVHAAEIGDDGLQDLPGSLHQVEAVLGVDQEQPRGTVSLVTLPAALEQTLVMP